MAYIPDFSRNAKGKFDPTLNFISIKGGTDAYLVEDEWNELQWIQVEERAKLIRTMTKSGCLQISNNVNSDDPGAYKAHLFLIRDSEDNIVQHADQITSTNELNSFTLNPFKAVLNGHIVRVESNKPEGLRIQLTDPYPTSKERQDLVILEFWFKEIRPYDKVPLFGGVENDSVSFEMLDHRISIPTTNRVQLQWRLRAVPDDKNEVAPHYDNGTNRIEYLGINPQGPRPYENPDYIYKTADFEPYNDDHMFVAGKGKESAISLDTIDGYVYAIPLFEVSRLNISGYNAYNNTNGGILWRSTDTISDRISLDGKFANVVYTNDINDQRYPAYLGTNELNDYYTKIKDFNKYTHDTNERIELNTNNIVGLANENEDLKRQVEFLTLLAL